LFVVVLIHYQDMNNISPIQGVYECKYCEMITGRDENSAKTHLKLGIQSEKVTSKKSIPKKIIPKKIIPKKIIPKEPKKIKKVKQKIIEI